MADHDDTTELVEQVREATARGTPLRIVGGDTKRFLGRHGTGAGLHTSGHSGIVSYDPAELVITARSGTPLRELEAALAARGQRLPFEPPSFGESATIGGTVACGLAGPARAAFGPLRDYVLGVRVLTGDGRVLRFGGEVIKNVAGYDVARSMAGAFGTLGVLLDVSLKVLPCPPSSRTLSLERNADDALAELGRLAGTAMPLTASCWCGGSLALRFEGTERTLDDVQRRVGGTPVEDAAGFWRAIGEHAHPFFAAHVPLWRLHVPAAAPALPMRGEPLIEWNGLQRWYGLDSDAVFDAAAAAGGHATLFRHDGATDAVFARPAEALMRLHGSLKRIFDPAGILNPGRMYADV
jgi:glycolate dehydrogenase FAD-binding subunit